MKLKDLPDIDKNSYTPMYVQLSEILNNYITLNKIPPNTLMPSEKELMERYDISRPTVRLAFQRLEASNLIHRARGKGTFISDHLKRQHLHSMFHTPEERFAEQGIEVKNIVLEFAEIDPQLIWIEELKLKKKSTVCILRRLKLIEEEPLCIEERVLPLEISRQLKNEDLKRVGIFKFISQLPNYGIDQIRYSFISRLISKEEAKEMNVDESTSVLIRRGIYYDRKGEPIMLSRVITLPELLDMEFFLQKKGNNWMVISSR